MTTLSGTVSAPGGGRVAGATVRIFDGANAGRSVTTNASGEYTIDQLTPGNANVTANAVIGSGLDKYDEVVRGAFLTGTVTMDFVFPTPSCQAVNTGKLSFGNRTTKGTTQDVTIDGVRVITRLAPGATSDSQVLAAGVAHSVSFFVSGTNTLACNTASPIVSQCQVTGLTCSG